MMVKEIPLTRGKFSFVDDEDYESLSKLKWYASIRNDGQFMAARKSGKGVYMHRLLMGAKKGEVVDHKDGNPLNNQRENLRIATPFQSSGNTRKHKGSVSVYKGLYWQKKNKKWVARIKKCGKTMSLGCFDNEKDAAMAYDRAAIEQWGEFALTNFDRRLYV